MDIVLFQMSRLQTYCIAAIFFSIVVEVGCRKEDPLATTLAPSVIKLNEPIAERLAELEKLTVVHLPNAIRIHPKVISGGMPDGEAAFRELVGLGVKTAISVDGVKPDIELANKYGLRYVHLPHGYNGLPEARVKELAKAVRDLDGTIYIHCHHGNHRSPTAACVACISNGWIDTSTALSVLKIAETGENYLGLFNSVNSARKLDDALLDALEIEFPEIATLPPIAEAMMAIEDAHGHLKRMSANDWQPQQTLNPAHEALLLREHFTEMLRMESVAKQPRGFQDLVKESISACMELEAAISHWKSSTPAMADPNMIQQAFQLISTGCVTCHRQFRDVPLTQTN